MVVPSYQCFEKEHTVPTTPDNRPHRLTFVVAVGALALSAIATTLTVTRPTNTTTPVASSPATGDATINASAKPAKGWTARDPALPAADAATTHDITFHIQDKVMEVAPGITQTMWTFNNQVPGPVLHGHVGDTFNVTLINDAAMPHSIDFHASQTPMNDNMRSINHGESLVYSFVAQYSGMWMYHCGTAPALDHIGNGMYGAVVIDPPNLPAVDHEYAIVQSELYLGPQGKPGDYTKMQSASADAVVFNGYYAQYKFSPITVNPHDRIRVWVLDAGPNENSSFHVVGTIFDTVFKEGNYTLPSGSSGGSQALDLQPAQGGFVEFNVSGAGNYAMVTHKFANVNKGAIGLIVAGSGTSMAG